MEKSKKIQSAIFCLLLTIIISMVVVLGNSFSWFTSSKSQEGTITVAKARVEIYSNGQLISSAKDSEGNVDDSKKSSYTYTIENTDVVNGTGHGIISFKNSSNVPALLSVRGLQVGYVNEDITNADGTISGDLTAFEKSEVQIGMDTSVWLGQSLFSSEIPNTGYSFNFFYNAKIDAGQEITFISSFQCLDENYIGTTMQIDMAVEVVAYESNAYKTSASVKPWDLNKPQKLSGWVAYK